MASIKPTMTFQEGATFVFGSWVCIADDAGGFRRHLGPAVEKKAPVSTTRPTVDDLAENLNEIQLSDLIGGHEYEFKPHLTSTQAQIGLLESDSNPSASGGGIHALCHDALADIFARLPSESVLRCGAVCKSWRRITTDGSFLAAHAARRPREMLVITPSLTVSSFPLTLAPARRRFLCDSAERNKNGTATWSRLLASLHGLLVFEQRPGLYAVCNPVTRQWTNLPVLAPDPCFTAFACGFYFHGSSGEYRLLCHGEEAASGWKDYYYVLAAGATRPRRLSRAPADCPVGYQQPVAHGEILYWSSRHPQADRTGKMLAFHTVYETFRLMSGPPGATMAQLLELDGSLCVCAQDMSCATRFDIWALQDHEAERWTLRLRVEVPPLRNIRSGGPWLVSTAITAGDGSFLLIGDPHCPMVVLFDIKRKKLVKEMHFRSTPTFIKFSESLVSHDFFQLPRCPELKPLKFPDEPMAPQNVTPNVEGEGFNYFGQ
ncbi:unnamed protein product [Urochloa decumbens]|uniref:F-box domain-containing protein n=1 Tax=Urochloa decumbens TaxID=240449 RepID=A0ABC8WI57_9POAL